MVELEIYREVRSALVLQAKRTRAAMRVTNRMGATTFFDRSKREWVACQFAMVALRKMLYGG